MAVLRKFKEIVMLTQNLPSSCSRFPAISSQIHKRCYCSPVTAVTQLSSRRFLVHCPTHSSSRSSTLYKDQLGLEGHRSKHYSSYRGNFIAKFSEEIDLDALREKKIRDLKNSGENIHVNEVVKKIIAEKCDEAISNLNEEDGKKLKVIQLEHDFLFSEGYSIPTTDEMTSENWLEALNLRSKQRRLKYYIALQKKKFVKQNAKKKKAEKPEEVTENRKMNDNKILLRVYDSTMKRWLNHRLSSAMQYGVPLVLDMEYADFMENREVKNTANQIQDLYCLNRADESMPFHLHFTGCRTDNPIYRTFQLLMQDDPNLMATVTPESYLEMFDKDKLVYLSPDGKQVMHEFDPTAVYIVGAFNDKATQKHVSYARAKEQGIKCRRLPLDHYLQWNVGSKSLTLNQMMAILMSLKNGHSWPDALKAVPARKYRPHNSR